MNPPFFFSFLSTPLYTNPSQDTIAHTHYRQFRKADQPTMHDFGLRKETGVPGGTGRARRLLTHRFKPSVSVFKLENSQP